MSNRRNTSEVTWMEVMRSVPPLNFYYLFISLFVFISVLLAAGGMASRKDYGQMITTIVVESLLVLLSFAILLSTKVNWIWLFVLVFLLMHGSILVLMILKVVKYNETPLSENPTTQEILNYIEDIDSIVPDGVNYSDVIFFMSLFSLLLGWGLAINYGDSE